MLVLDAIHLSADPGMRIEQLGLTSTESAASMDSLYRSWSARAARDLNRRSGNLNEQFRRNLLR